MVQKIEFIAHICSAIVWKICLVVGANLDFKDSIAKNHANLYLLLEVLIDTTETHG